ncbi:gamma-secretase subunit [Aureococcus anophagefferens]|uniref:Gamma-secretase subunit n=1 Tax=Aureococcus anophagefferens TaxID=44056 RepID=A0ABR1FUM7_AURAN
MPTARPALFLLAALRAATPFHARPVAVRRPTARRSEREPYEAYDPYEENLWLDDGDEEALTFGNEQLTLSGEGNAFGDSTVAFALLEAVTSLDAAEVEDAYVAFDLARVAGLLEAPLAEVFAACVDEGFGLPHGVETQLRREQYEALRSRFGFAAYAPDPLDKVYEDFGFKPLDETAEPLDPEARKMPEYVQDADRPTYQDGA